MVKRPLIVGEAPSMRTSRPFAGRSGERLADLAGVPLEQLRSRFRLVNLLAYWPGPSASGKGSAFPLAEARSRAGETPLPPGSLLCGRRVAQAFGLGRAPFLEWVEGDARGGRTNGAGRPTARVAVIPHPSGVCRWWNDPENVDAARRFLREALA